jgi:hypothetical protein
MGLFHNVTLDNHSIQHVSVGNFDNGSCFMVQMLHGSERAGFLLPRCSESAVVNLLAGARFGS